MDIKANRFIIVGVAAFIVGWAVGLFLFGWRIWPLEYTGAFPENLTRSYQEEYIVGFADLYSFDNDIGRVQEAFKDWPEAPQVICDMADTTVVSGEEARLKAIASLLVDGGCTDIDVSLAASDVDDGGGSLSNIVLICGLLALLLVVVVAIFLVWQRRKSQPGGLTTLGRDGMTGFMPESVQPDQQITPIARFQTIYAHGHDTYDESFSIESADGDFLGECGVGLSETIGTDLPKNVTAFEVWLFDKNDIRTVTKVVMSDHAFFDEAIKAKLAPKGEPVLARPDETIVLETATLIVNAVITELEYGREGMPSQSYFERFVVELSAWAKEGNFPEPDIQGQVDDMLDF